MSRTTRSPWKEDCHEQIAILARTCRFEPGFGRYALWLGNTCRHNGTSAKSTNCVISRTTLSFANGLLESLPMVVPGTWAGQPAYYEKLSLLAVTQTPEIRRLEEFLKNLKAATVQARDKQSSERVSKAPAKQTDACRHRASRERQPGRASPTRPPISCRRRCGTPSICFTSSFALKEPTWVPLLATWPRNIPAALQMPPRKTPASAVNQLLQLIVRYEGDGIIDSNVNEFMKLYLKAAAAEVVDPSWPERINAEAKPGKKTSSTWPATTEDQPIPFDPRGNPVVPPALPAAWPSTGGVSSPPVYMPPPPGEVIRAMSRRMKIARCRRRIECD